MDVTREGALTARQKSDMKYRRSEKGIANREAHDQTPKRKAAKREYATSDKGKQNKIRYLGTNEVQENRRRFNEINSLDHFAERHHGQKREFSKEEEKDIKRSVKVQDQPPGQEGVLLPRGESLQYNSPNTVRSTLQTLKRQGKLDPGQEKVQMMGRELGQVSSESEDSTDRKYNELE
jgi:hypothetical protein